MAARVEFTDKNGNVKNMDKPLAMRLQARKKGKITKVLRVGNKNSAANVASLEEDLLNAEIKIEEQSAVIEKLKAANKVAKKPANKADKGAANRNTK